MTRAADNVRIGSMLSIKSVTGSLDRVLMRSTCKATLRSTLPSTEQMGRHAADIVGGVNSTHLMASRTDHPVPLQDLLGRLLRQWLSFSRPVNHNFRPRAFRLNRVPAGDGTAHIFKTSCPSFLDSSTRKFVVLNEA